MPRLSQNSAPNVQDAGPAVDRSGDLDDITVDFVTITESHPCRRRGLRHRAGPARRDGQPVQQPLRAHPVGKATAKW